MTRRDVSGWAWGPAIVGGADEKARRSTLRRRTHLHVGRVYDRALRFLCEVTIHDVSGDGARIRMQRRTELPDLLLLADETDLRLGQAQLRWRKDDEAGLVIVAWRGLDDMDRMTRGKLFGDYYAATDE